jgi:hypothetical protein
VFGLFATTWSGLVLPDKKKSLASGGEAGGSPEQKNKISCFHGHRSIANGNWEEIQPKLSWLLSLTSSRNPNAPVVLFDTAGSTALCALEDRRENQRTILCYHSSRLLCFYPYIYIAGGSFQMRGSCQTVRLLSSASPGATRIY